MLLLLFLNIPLFLITLYMYFVAMSWGAFVKRGGGEVVFARGGIVV